jgi:hypothetical protein
VETTAEDIRFLGRFQGTPGLEPRRLYSLFIRLVNSALEAGVCQAETEKLYRIDGRKDGRKDRHGAKVEEPEEVPGTGNPALLTLAVFTRLSQTSLGLSHAMQVPGLYVATLIGCSIPAAQKESHAKSSSTCFVLNYFVDHKS